ncbi:flagellar hook-associated protein FlgK [Blastococcus xanthinilyticus]|uniref:Flagellar hook-associated protein 1 n=1 Tax=Blastococcus xanthinilyticus TaxID=1564164 RepID=A0A5S5CVF7_9ACTN|nr:flagellar hook-associated protein FlgK [Blastococcus xanthinilyticus]TYP86309.1 flagellar hook-associated protein 1 FlgK [Blastococcus xanthinilyticus]
MSTFSGLNTATTSLWAQRRALDVTGQNISNVNTEGYSRQRVDMRAIGGSAVPAFYSTGSGIGGGVNADEVTRIRDAFLEGRGHTEHANSARLVAETDAYELVEQSFREPGTTGLQNLMSDMWRGWQDVANKPEDPAARGQVLKRLETLVGGLHFSRAQLDGQWEQTRENLGVLVDDVNAAAETIAKLNTAILRASQSGLPANDLTDQRDALVMKLADQVGVSVVPRNGGVVDVIVGSVTLVAGGQASKLAVAGTIDPTATAGDPPRIVTATGALPVTVGGTAGGQLHSLNSVLPTYRAELDGVAADLATTLNTAHAAGFDLGGVAGGPLLGSSGGPITAASITVVLTEPEKIAASSIGPGTPNLDHGNADALAQLGSGVGSPDTRYRRMIVELGVQSAVSQRNLGIQSVITGQVDAARESVAGVNLDEEMTNMLSFQHAYSAAGRLVTAIDEMLDVLINRTGRVGL